MIRICHVITGLAADGAERMLFNLVTGMDRERFRNEVVSLTTTGDLGRPLEEAGIAVRALGLGRNWRSVTALAGLRRQFRQMPPDVVQTWMYHADLLGGVVAQSSGIRRVFWGIHHSNLDWGSNKFLTVATAKACAMLSGSVPRRIVCCSDAARTAHAEFGYSRERTDWIPNGFDTARFRPDPEARREFRSFLGADGSDVLVGLAARFHPDKDHANFLGAAAQVLRRHPNAFFVLCGRGVSWENEAFLPLLRQFELSDRVRLLGAVRQPEHFFAAMDIGVSSSRTEAFPLAVGEGMSCGVPCAVTDVGDSALLVGDTGFAAPPRNPAALGEAIGKLVAGGPELRSRLGAAARRRMEESFSLQSVVAQYQNLYTQAMLQ